MPRKLWRAVFPEPDRLGRIYRGVHSIYTLQLQGVADTPEAVADAINEPWSMVDWTDWNARYVRCASCGRWAKRKGGGDDCGCELFW